MTTSKKLGIWMDHASAHLTELTPDPIQTTVITSNSTHLDKEASQGKGEILAHHKEHHKHAEFYKKLAETIRKYSEVVLFGPTDAKVELYNIMKTDHLYSNIKIEVRHTDNMSEYQQHIFIREHFNPDKINPRENADH